jgi:hypothetical protein
MSKQITINYCGMEGVGQTVTKAKQDAARKIESALDGHYNPTLIFHAGNVGVVARDPLTGWQYRVVWNAQNCNSGVQYLGGSFHATEKNAIHGCAHHMAQIAGNYIGLEKYFDAATMRDLDRYYAWQETYAEVKCAGGNDEQCRASADIAR